MDEQLKKAEELVARVLTAICTTGFTTDWTPGQRNSEHRETFRFDNSERMKIIAGGEALAMITEVRRGDKVSSSLPEQTDWTFGGIVEWAQSLTEQEIARLPQANNRLEPISAFRKLVAAMNTDAPMVQIGGSRYRAYWDDDVERLTVYSFEHDDKWGADAVLSRGR